MSRNLFFGITNRVLMLIAAALTLLSVLSVLVNPAKFWVASLLGLCFVPLVLLDFVLLLWALKRRSKSFVIPLVALIPAALFLGLYVRLPFSGDTDVQENEDKEVVTALPGGKNGLKIMTYNVGRFMLAQEQDALKGRHQCMDSVFRFIVEEQPDIVCLQEFYIDEGESVAKVIPKYLKGYAAEYYLYSTQYGLCGNLTLSRLKSVGKGKLTFDSSANLAIYSDYETDGHRFRIYNCHFESYNISFTGLVRSLTNSQTDVFAQTGVKMKRSITMRPRQVDKVLYDIENCPIESFVCGDFNDNPMSYTYYRMTRGRRDAFVDAGHGFGATYSLLWPMLRIDYLLYPDSYRAVSYDVPRIGLSDHYPAIAEIVYN